MIPSKMISESERLLKSAMSKMNTANLGANYSIVVKSKNGNFTIPKEFELDLIATLDNA